MTWNTTDVDDKLDLGWGLTLGRSFNYDYGKILSFDLRGRYLRGYWYGQDYPAEIPEPSGRQKPLRSPRVDDCKTNKRIC